MRQSIDPRNSLVEGLSHRDEGDAMGVERLDQLGEVGERSSQPIDLINDDDVDPSGLHIDEQFLQSGPIHRAAGKAAIVVTVPDQPPALVSLALDVGLGRLTLGVEGVEIQKSCSSPWSVETRV